MPRKERGWHIGWMFLMFETRAIWAAAQKVFATQNMCQKTDAEQPQGQTGGTLHAQFGASLEMARYFAAEQPFQALHALIRKAESPRQKLSEQFKS